MVSLPALDTIMSLSELGILNRLLGMLSFLGRVISAILHSKYCPFFYSGTVTNASETMEKRQNMSSFSLLKSQVGWKLSWQLNYVQFFMVMVMFVGFIQQIKPLFRAFNMSTVLGFLQFEKLPNFFSLFSFSLSQIKWYKTERRHELMNIFSKLAINIDSKYFPV
jgi:hypothetical protein